MNSNRKLLITFGLVLTALVLFITPVSAQNGTDPTAFLVYFDDDFELEVFDSAGDYIGEVFIGMELFPGSTIKTYNTSAEIQLDPNGSILKISENSIFQIEAFQRTPDESNDFSLFNGKLRVIAARAGLGYENYSIITQSAVCGVRGTDFVIDSIGVVAVREGAVEFSSLLNGDTISVTAGQFADVFADTFQAVAASAQSLASIFGGLDFKGTDPAQVPGHTPAVSEPPADTEPDEAVEETPADEDGEDQPADDQTEADTDDGEETADEPEAAADEPSKEDTAGSEPAEEPKQAPKPSRTGSAAAAITARSITDATETESDEGETDAEESEPGPLDKFFKGLGNLLAFEIGSINIDGITYAKAVVQPEFEIGKFRAKFYIPVIYQENLFDPESWYHPAGNDEWSFGTDQDEALDIALDVINDLFLKIHYLQWGDNGDDFYFKFGNLDNMTIGHGILMRNFSNNFEFPAVRKVGINAGINFEKFGVEAVLDNASAPTIFGGRLVFIPFGSSFPMGLGLSAITDINPDSETETVYKLFDPLVLNAALDIGLPIDLINMTLFAELAGLTVYQEQEWHIDTFYNSAEPNFLNALNNYGLVAGFYGDLFSLNYRLEYRLSKGVFTPAFYSNNYLASKVEQYAALQDFIADPANPVYQEYTMGVFGELSANIFDAVTLSGSYLWPWQINDGVVDFSADDSFSISAALMPDIIPVVGLYGSVSYTRTGLVNSIRDAVNGAEKFALINADTLISGELVYPFDPSLDIALQFATAYSRDDDGKLIYTDDVLDTYFAMSVDMRIHF